MENYIIIKVHYNASEFCKWSKHYQNKSGFSLDYKIHFYFFISWEFSFSVILEIKFKTNLVRCIQLLLKNWSLIFFPTNSLSLSHNFYLFYRFAINFWKTGRNEEILTQKCWFYRVLHFLTDFYWDFLAQLISWPWLWKRYVT